MATNDQETALDAFKKLKFNMDKFVAEFAQKCKIKDGNVTLKEELQGCAVTLHIEMSELINNHTEGILNVAEYTSVLGSEVDDVSISIKQFKANMRLLYDLTDKSLNDYDLVLNTIENCHKKLVKRMLDVEFELYYKLFNNDVDFFTELNDLDIFERIVTRYVFYMSNFQKLNVDTVMCESITHTGKQLIMKLNKMFISSIKTNDTKYLLRCLCQYRNLNEINEAEKCCREELIRPILTPMLTKAYLKTCNNDIDVMYYESIVNTEKQLFILFNVPHSKEFNFMLNSYSKELADLTRINLPNLAAPGNPDLFQTSYTKTLIFLKYIAKKCGDVELVKKHSIFVEFMNRFNLSVYYEIRHQQICSELERFSELKPLSPEMYNNNNTKTQFKLAITDCLWNCIQKCFHPNIYIERITDKFVELTMLLVSRYQKLLYEYLNDIKNFNNNSESWEMFLINCLVDSHTIKTLIGYNEYKEDYINDTVYKIAILQIDSSIIHRICKINNKYIDENIEQLSQMLINMKCEFVINKLQHVKSIPRVYRRTNKPAPIGPNNYVTEAVQPIIEFSQFKHLLGGNIYRILHLMINQIGRVYLDLVREVLTSVCRTEESLRRLKSRNLNIIEDTASVYTDLTDSDEKKIRNQIKYDTIYFVEMLEPLIHGFDTDILELLKNEC